VISMSSAESGFAALNVARETLLVVPGWLAAF
jgi:hypothetical protein